MKKVLPYVKRKIVDYNSLLDMKEDMDGSLVEASTTNYNQRTKKRESKQDKSVRSTKIKNFVKPFDYPDINKELIKLIPLLDDSKFSDDFYVFEYNYLIYGVGDHFTKHRDLINGEDLTIDWSSTRVFSTSTMISESADFQGGEFIFYDKYNEEGEEIKIETGETLLFDATKGHEVKPVTKGTREVLVAWIAYKRRSI